MFDLGWSEIAVIAVVALVVIGPKDLPVVLRTIGQYVRKARSMAAEFQSGIEQMARDAEVEQMRKELEAAQRTVQTDLTIEQGQIAQEAQTEIPASAVAEASEPPVEDALPVASPPETAVTTTSETSTHARSP